MDQDRNDEAALDAAGMLELLHSQQREVERRTGAFVPFIMLAWALAWSVGFGILWLIDGAEPVIDVPLPIAVAVFIVVMLAAVGVSAFFGIRSSRGLRSTRGTAFTGTVYGLTWSAASVAIVVFGRALYANGMTDQLATIFYPTSFVLMAGFMYIIAGAIWRAVTALVAGAWIVLVALVAPFFGYPTHYLIFSIAGGGGFVVFAIITAVYFRRGSRSARRMTPADA